MWTIVEEKLTKDHPLRIMNEVESWFLFERKQPKLSKFGTVSTETVRGLGRYLTREAAEEMLAKKQA
jgi:hypothetical protein